jgi:hypothetical protein
VRTVQLLVTLAAVAAAFVSAEAASAAPRCPTQTFLRFDRLVYAGDELPASAAIAPGAGVGSGIVDEPVEASGCKRRQESVPVRRMDGVDPSVAVTVESRPRTIFVLGARCAGYPARERSACLLDPLVFDGRPYTGTRYPAEPRPRGRLRLGRALGRAQLGGETVTVARIEGVDPALAVGVRGRPSEAFLAAGVCPYERFENRPARDDLLRCLRSPVWLFFDPLGGAVGTEVVATSDRPLRAELAGATVSLVRLDMVADVVPEDRSRAVPLGPLGSTMRLTIPDLPPGLYEAVVSCRRCAAVYGGRTVFPAGSLSLFEEQKGSGTIRIVSIGLGVAVFALAIASVVVWRRGRRRRPSEAGSARS